MNSLSSFLLLIFFVSTPVFSKSSLSLSGIGEKTSDPYEKTTYKLAYVLHQWEPGWAYSDEKSQDYNIGFNYERRKGVVLNNSYIGDNFNLFLGKKWSDNFYLTSELGSSRFQSSPIGNAAISTTRGSVKLKVYYQYWTKQTFKLSYSSGMYHETQLSTGLVNSPLNAKKLKLNTNNYLTKKFKVNTQTESRWIDNGVRRKSLSINLLYGWSSPWVWFGFGGDYVDHSKKVPEFYSPLYTKSIGPRFEMNYLLTEKMGTLLAINYNFSKEEKLESSHGL